MSPSAAKQAAWALTGTMPEWPVPYVSERKPSQADVSAAAEIGNRYRSVLSYHYGV